MLGGIQMEATLKVLPLEAEASLSPTQLAQGLVENVGRVVIGKKEVFTQVLLADEINRATPRTQSSLLEAMEEQNVTVDGTLHRLISPFFVIATQNPVELEGTYPL